MNRTDQGQDQDLAGCPFCGCDPYVHTPDFNGDHYQIGCYADGCGGEEGEDGAVWVNGRTFEEAKERWHRRTCPPLTPAEWVEEPPTPEAMHAWAEWFDDPNRSPSMSVQPSPVHALRFAPGYLLRLIAGEMEQPTDKE